jgi:Xaa-Pro aminopeptidase
MKKGVRRMGFEATDLPYETAHKMKGLGLKTRLVPVKRLVETIRAVKDAEEIMLLRASAGLAKKILKRVVAHVRPGVSEKSLSDRIEREFLLNGAKAGYDPIVAVDRNSSRPHARPEHYRRVRKGSFVMIDLGCKLNGYASDMTRMATTGKVKDKFKRIYNIVRRAQEKAIAAIRPGRPVSEVDLAARRYIEGEGFGKYFLHSTGHGIGLDVHESPSVSAYNTDPLEAGMVFTVEPAIYIAGFGGARIEDMALVTEDGCDVLTG